MFSGRILSSAVRAGDARLDFPQMTRIEKPITEIAMDRRYHKCVTWSVTWIVLVLFFGSSDSFAGGKASFYGIYMVPYGSDARSFSRPGWGGGFELVLPIEQTRNLFAGTAGIELVNMLSQRESFQDQATGLLVNQETDQNYLRLYLGLRVGGHGNGFLRPHVGVNVALVYYNIGTDLVVPDDYNPGNEVRQHLSDEGKAVLGYDVTMGLDLNFSNAVAVDGGVKYLKSFSVPQQLGNGSVKVYPQYFQIYIEFGFSFDYLRSHMTGVQE